MSIFESTQSVTTVLTYKKIIPIIKESFNDAIILDYGAGLGLGADTLRKSFSKVETFEPYPQRWMSKIPPTYSSNPPTKKYSVIVCINVINVLKKKERNRAILNMLKLLKKKSMIIFKARKYNGDLINSKYAIPGIEPKSMFVKKGDNYVFHKGYDGDDLYNEICQFIDIRVFSVDKVKDFVIVKKV